MFGDTPTFSSFSVNDLGAAKTFYGDTLGLKVTERPEGLGLELASGSAVFIYPKDDHVPATFTILNFQSSDLDGDVAKLAAKGVTFETYEHTDEHGINRGPEGPAIAWFKDPAGNFLSVLQEET